MKRLCSLLVLSLLMLASAFAVEKSGGAVADKAAEAKSLPDAWAEVHAAQKAGKPKTAIELIKPLIKQAVEAGDYPFAVKAIGYRIKAEGDIEGHKAEERITRMHAELATAPAAMKPIMQTLLAHWYWGYFQQNRWRFMQRTQTAAVPGDDILSWDLTRIFAEIDSHFTTALTARETLSAIPMASWSMVLDKPGYTTSKGEKGGVRDSYRPTLYDFVAHEALSFYRSGEQAGAKSQDAFELSVDSPVFDTPAAFMAWKIDTSDEDTNVVKALRLMQELMRFHAKDEDIAAFIDVDLLRLSYGKNTAVGPDKTARYKAALKRFIKENADHRISARALAALADELYKEGDRVKALALAQRGTTLFYNSPGGNQCYNLVQRITSKSSQIKTERVWNAPWPKIAVTYRNLTNVHFRVVSQDWEKLIKRKGWQWEQLDHAQRQALLKRDPVASWSAPLPPTTDYHDRQELLPALEDLAPGFYILLSSHKADFSEGENVVSHTPIWVSDLALVMRDRRGSGKLEGFVLDARLGRPIAGATVRSWSRARRGEKAAGPETTTDANGLFRLSVNADRASHIVLVSHDGQQVSSTQAQVNSWRAETPRTQTLFFTDRSLYRPGQTVRYKGLCIRFDREGDNYAVLGGQDVTVKFRDANGKEITHQKHKANDYGSFAGSFTAPADRATGRMTILVDGDPRGRATVRVEEYKRPKFKVTLDAPTVAARLDGEVTLEGHAMAYTGAAIDGAPVSYRVVREVRYPDWWRWCRWWFPPQQGGSQEIAHGKSASETDGSFSITFTAKPDRSVDKASEPTFRYTVHADVTDATGETRSSQRYVNVGYTALKAALSADEWQDAAKPVEIGVSTQTLDGEGQAAEVTVKVHKLKAPERVQRARLQGAHPYWRHGAAATVKPVPDLSDPNSWALGEVVDEQTLKTLPDGSGVLSVKLKPGLYRAVLATQDRFKKEVSALLPIRVVDIKARTCRLRVPSVVAAPAWSLQPGDSFTALWGSGYETARAYIEIEHRGKMLRAFWSDTERTQEVIEQTVTEAMRGGFTLHVTQLRENRAYLTSRKIDVPWRNKELSITWEHMVSKLEPGQTETWTAVIEGPDAESAVAEMVAGLYDKSLDAFNPHNWQQRFNVFRQDRTRLRASFQNSMRGLERIQGGWRVDSRTVNLNYWRFPRDLLAQHILVIPHRRRMLKSAGRSGGRGVTMAYASAAPMAASMSMSATESLSTQGGGKADFSNASGGDAASEAPPAPDLSQVSARKNLQETAFFFPQLVSDGSGKVKLEFTMPEALTEWKFMAFAHDKELRSGFLQDSVVTAKDIMVQPNPPRFLRESDVLEFTVKVSNLSPTRQEGKVRLSFADARTLKAVNAQLGLQGLDKAFDVPAKESRTFSWRVTVPDGMGFLQYKAVGATSKLSDGEEGYLPVLPRRIMVTESLPLPIRKAGEKAFRFEKLIESAKSDTLAHQNLVVQMVSNPSWYAVMALPYLMEYQHQCSEQTFNRLYANAVARHIAKSDPKIRRIFDLWKGTDALKSPMEKNQDLKAVMLEETPWLAQGEDESEARRRVGVLFDDNRLDKETAANMRRMAELQLSDGAWPWFPGGRGSDYITLYITTGYGRIRHLGVKGIQMAPAIKSLNRLDGWIDKIYRDILKHKTEDSDHLSSTIALYLYGRSFFLEDQTISATHREAVDYFLDQASKYWLKLPRQSQAHLALAVKRFGQDRETPAAIMTSLREFSKTDDEMGMFWRDEEYSWWWYRAPIETQAMMIEAFDEVAGDKQSVEDCKVWLLKQKQTQDWKTTKATADAVYALLLRGSDLLASDELVKVSLAGKTIEPKDVEPGTGFYEERFGRGEIKPAMGEITLTKVDDGVAWGSLHWQYFEDMSKVTPHEGTPLKLEKALYTKVNTKKGPVLQPVEGAIAVGDELVTRIVLRVDRDMEYVHLKDQRGSGTEPVNVLSSYKYQDGLRYYESTKDTASHFFIDYLPKGTYVFEYSSRVQHRGAYQSGMASVQCMYAPEFNSHSQSFSLRVEQ
ncbi:MAG: hypothetical protein HN919_18650 [Verrucomicrobia bacterium]|jgi:uncharacterized protein YfaS (alpha-2-macroglobulin family)|nr:hypothetical protein [Verrucomicrobiota bacterium]MBT7068324.1 hypothetical protein [Verrucomicrobiota bacterium]MBT7699933.1 hypothetical protein [Verrucomicrobiota bacterium]